jgi:hypothetical protein
VPFLKTFLLKLVALLFAIFRRARKQLRWFPVEPATVGLYAAELAGRHKTGTITPAGRDQPISPRSQLVQASMKFSAVREVMRGIKRERGVQVEAKAGLSTDELRSMVTALPPSLRGLRESCAAN